MYVCICKAVTDRQIREAVSEGAATMRDLRRELGVCAGCGKCGRDARVILRESLEDSRIPTAYPAPLAAAC